MIAKNISIVRNLLVKNLKLKYKQSFLGILWSLLTPLAFLTIFHFVFSKVFVTIENYTLYALTGLIFWQFFSNASNQGIQSFIQNASIIKTINVPIGLFPLSAVATEIVALGLSFIPFGILMYFFGLQFSWHFLLIIPAIVLFAGMAYGIGVFLGVLNVYLRDVGILWNTLNPALFYLTPIAYDPSILPEKFLIFIKLNPLYHYMVVFRDILYRNSTSSIENWLIILAISLSFVAIGRFTILKLEKGIISNI